MQYVPRKVWVDGPERNVRLDYDRNSMIPSVPGSLPSKPGPVPPAPVPPAQVPPAQVPTGHKYPSTSTHQHQYRAPVPPGPPTPSKRYKTNVCLLTTFLSALRR